jgi:hypothetical protein
LSYLLSLSAPFLLCHHLAQHLITTHRFSDLDCTHASNDLLTVSFSTHVHGSRPIPTPSNWLQAYNNDPDTKLLFKHLKLGIDFTKPDIQQLNPAYREYIRENRIAITDAKLTVFQPCQNNTDMLMLIIVPLSLRRDIFSAYHASPSTGHMGVYKTLHRIRLRFFWPQCRKDITSWVLQCPHCIAVNGTVSRNSELIFSWPLCCPFYILHVDLWAPGEIANYRGDTYLMNSMCDLTGFVMVTATNDITSANLARLFVQDVLLKVGFCGLVVVDDGSTFKSLFITVLKMLGITHHLAARGNHKAVAIERFHRFLNKAVGIAANDRGTNDVFVEAAHTAAYAWNSSPIDGTDIVRSVPAVGRPFRFPFDISLSTPPTPTENQGLDVHGFLRFAQPTAQFSEQVLRLLTDERRSSHRERANASRTQITFQPGDLVMARVQVQSNSSTSTVAKLSYRKRGPYEIIATEGFGSYSVRKYGRPDAPLLKYPTQSLSALPPALLPCSPLDTPDFRYLNHSHAPLPHPLRHPFNIHMYNNMWFSPDIKTNHPPLFEHIDLPCSDSSPNSPDCNTPDTHVSIPTAASIPLAEPDPAITTQPPSSAPSLLSAILASTDKLFFVSYAPAGTLRPRWYLVQVDMLQTPLNPPSKSYPSTGIYYCHFFGKHPDDAALLDPASRYWPLWHRFSTASDGVIDFGERVLFTPPQIPSASKYIAWADSLPLLDLSLNLLGPFDFLHPTDASCPFTPSSRQIIPLSLWSDLALRCLDVGFIPPILSKPANARSRWSRSRRS